MSWDTELAQMRVTGEVCCALPGCGENYAASPQIINKVLFHFWSLGQHGWGSGFERQVRSRTLRVILCFKMKAAIGFLGLCQR